jgi:hypothetical protein
LRSRRPAASRDVHHTGKFAFHARIERSHPGDIASALDSRALVKVASARGTITIVPGQDAANADARASLAAAPDETVEVRVDSSAPGARKTGTTLRTTIEPFANLPRPVVESIEEEVTTWRR